MNKKKPTGTLEWAQHNHNIGKGCSSACKYCYARSMAKRFGRIKSDRDWETETIIDKMVNKKWQKLEGRIMFPTTHDISPYYLDSSLIAISRMLNADNKVLIVTKANYECVKKICDMLMKDYPKADVLFRFTIGSLQQSVCNYWDSNAPKVSERIKSLKYAFYNGFKTSISAEPLLGGIAGAFNIYLLLSKYVTDSIWFGKMRDIDRRVAINNDNDRKQIELIKKYQSDSAMKALYAIFKDEEKVRWKDSIKKVVGINEPNSIGLDI